MKRLLLKHSEQCSKFFCFQTDLSLTSSVSAGAELAIRECADQFRAEVWNCPVTAFRSRREERGNNRETAYIQAVTAAAVTHTLTRNCSQGSLLVSCVTHLCLFLSQIVKFDRILNICVEYVNTMGWWGGLVAHEI